MPKRTDKPGEHANSKQAQEESSTTRFLNTPKLSIKEASQRAGIGQTVLRRLINEAAIPVLKIEGKVMILEDDLEQFLAARYVRLRAQDLDERRLPPLPDEVRDSPYL